jgi:glycosyltransferase involved in cell wall biosynthesis
MRNNRPKVLMLGWEFPPVINGGLGVACHDLSVAMAEFVDLTMIVPKTSPEFKVKNLQLLGVNNIDQATLRSMALAGHAQKLPFELHEVVAELDPYYRGGKKNILTMEREIVAPGDFIEYVYKVQQEPFNFDSLYGGDVIRKVMQFADIAAGLAASMEFDVIHAHDWMTMIAGIKISRFSGKPLVVHIHSLEVDRSGPESRGWVYDLEKHGMELADLVLPVSNFTAGNISRHYGISRDKMVVVHNGSRPVTAFKGKRIFDEKTVLFVGRLTRQKGPEKFLEIAARVLQKNPDVRFVMAGVGEWFTRMLEQSAYHHIGNRFHMTGFLDLEKLHYLFSVSDVYCMPSVSEPFGLSAVEAAQFGIPCVISKQSGVAEVLTGAFKFDYWDVHKAADAILKLLEDKTLRKKVVKDAARNLKDITWENSARKIVKAYSEKIFSRQAVASA